MTRRGAAFCGSLRMESLTFNYHYPDKNLSQFVKYFWCLENSGSSKHVTVLPDGYFDIMFTFSSKSGFTVSLIGLATKPKDYVIPADSKAFSISFKLPAAESILNASINSIVDTRSLLPNDLWGVAWSTITSPETFFATAAACLTTLSPTFSDDKKRVLFENLYKKNGDIRVAELARLAHWDARKINRYFRGQFGLTLKSYCNIMRFRSAFEYFRKQQDIPQHYFDQSHFIREVWNFSGTSPKHLITNENRRFIQLSTLPTV